MSGRVVGFITGAAYHEDRSQGDHSHAIWLAKDGAETTAIDTSRHIEELPYSRASSEWPAMTVKEEVESLDPPMVTKPADLPTAMRSRRPSGPPDRLDIASVGAGIGRTPELSHDIIEQMWPTSDLVLTDYDRLDPIDNARHGRVSAVLSEPQLASSPGNVAYMPWPANQDGDSPDAA
jgi:hypothetical protein